MPSKQLVMKPTFISLILFICLAFLHFGCSKSSNSNNNGGGNNNAGTSIGMSGMSFSPGTTSIKAGSTITWTNNDNTSHTVTADDNSFDSGSIPVGGKFIKTFPNAGSFPYHCNFHGGMTGTITVTQ